MEPGVVFYILIFLTALLYASVGHGGASGYLAIMAIFSVSPEYMRSSALLLNLFVSAVSFYSFYRGGFFRLRLLLPFVLLSVPASFLGARVNLEPRMYKTILGIFLLIAIARMLFIARSSDKIRPLNYSLALTLGALLGFFSGMIGIGGGIILSPVLLLFRWASIKETAAASALFILLNSASGVAGLYTSGNLQPLGEIYWMVLAGLGGSFLGAYLGTEKMSALHLTYLLAGVLLFASLKLLYL